ncbi:MAG: phosphoheptose isomerase [Bacteroidota bacterium]
MIQLPLFDLPPDRPSIFNKVESHLADAGFTIRDRALEKPWGGFYAIDEALASRFAEYYFPGVPADSLRITASLSPKILLVEPGKRLSWQYHFRRAEIWRLVAGEAAITTSDDDVERHNREIQMGEIIRLRQGERHRLIGLKGWGMIAEIWQHTDAGHLSDESDIVRVQDDFTRN